MINTCIARFTRLGQPALAGLLIVASSGCLSPWMGSKDEKNENEVAAVEELFQSENRPKLVRDATVSMGMNPVKLEAIGIVNGLAGTGGIPEPSPQRDSLLAELKTRNVNDPNQFLDSNQSAMVSVEAFLPAGVQKDDPIDLYVRISTRSNATSLRGGWLMPARLQEVRLLNNQLRTSDMLALGTGPILIRSAYEAGDEKALIREGVIPSGGRSAKARSIGLIIRPAYQHAFISAQIANDINRRFFFFDGTSRRGIANAKEDDFIELSIHPTYHRNIPRLMSVVQSVAIKDSIDERHVRIKELAARLTEPSTAAAAALQLEAIGDEGAVPLKVAATVANPEIRFYAAESLAYMDEVEAIDPLVELVRSEPAFRHRALLALSILEHRLAAEGLRELMDESSVETRYGAFRNLRERPDRELLVPGTQMPEGYSFFHVASKADPLVVVSTLRFAEVVVFGGPVPIRPPKYLMAGSGIMVRGDDAGKLRISRFQPGKPDTRSIAQPTVAGLIKGISDVGGNYSDVVEVLRLAKQQGDLEARFAIDPLPKTVRTYHRESESEDEEASYEELGPSNIDPPVGSGKKDSWWKF
ncbi:flagellar basal body P-ring protein [Rosistilla carotiformis]|uniref:Flagellar basal body P-ring protein n=1 Tax=Rosistilla carotiformis TaxID=2528017 RepID=A0A518JY30_9BACT|nr:flagellar basal body P-ring protein FlgI [Rosistilla carotiformis]QDV70444.1 flagellar basal body P-ring protein [Rosistilla carotiformis]